jgi:arginase
MCAGQRKAGVDTGPQQLRDAGLVQNLNALGWITDDFGDLHFPSSNAARNPNTGKDGGLEDDNYVKGKTARNPSIVGPALEIIYNATLNAHKKNNFVMTLGGDHSIGCATVLSALTHRPETGVIWVDAHADINTPETSESGNLHGMPLALAMNLCDRARIPGMKWLSRVPIMDPSQLVYIGLRDIDAGERKFIKSLGIKTFTMHDVDKYGIAGVMKQTFKHLRLPNGQPRPLHLSYDIDACDPAIAPATGTLVRGGFSFREAHYVAESTAATGQLGSMDLVEVNASLVPKMYEEQEAPDMTVQFGVALLSSAMGSRIL